MPCSGSFYAQQPHRIERNLTRIAYILWQSAYIFKCFSPHLGISDSLQVVCARDYCSLLHTGTVNVGIFAWEVRGRPLGFIMVLPSWAKTVK